MTIVSDVRTWSVTYGHQLPLESSIELLESICSTCVTGENES